MKRARSENDAARALAKGRFGQAQLAFLERLRHAPHDDEALLGLGRAFLGAGDTKHAYGCFEKLVARSPEHALAWRWLGLARHRLGRPESAADAFERSAALSPADPETHVLLGGARLANERVDDAERAFRCATQLAPRDARAWLGLGSCLATRGLATEARTAFERGLAVEPSSLALRWALAAAVPLVHDGEDALRAEIARTTRVTRELGRFVDERSRSTLAGALGAVQDNFRAHYFGADVTSLQRVHGRLVHRVASAAMPELTSPLPPRDGNGRVRVGFVSSCFRSHTVLELFERWMTELDADRFEVFVYQLGHLVDARTATLARAVEHFHHEPRDPRALGRRVRDDGLDVVIFPEVGMDRRVLTLAATRLAPVQVATCGHPVTTGLPTIDVFLSGELVEPPDAATHYTERLVLLPGVGLTPNLPTGVVTAHDVAQDVAQELACDPPRDETERARVRDSLGLPTAGPLLLACQSLFKYLPQHDAVLARIAKGAPDATIAMLSHPSADVTDRFRRRLDAAFAARGLRLDDHVRLLPRLAHADYLALNHAADVFLDSLEFSAGRSGFEALAMGLVPVTTRGRFARGRYLAAALTALGHDALIADDENEYVALALALAHDPARRATLSRDLRARAGRPFDGHAVLAAFQRFLEGATPSKVLAAASPA